MNNGSNIEPQLKSTEEVNNSGLTASPLSKKIQELGGQMLASTDLVEVEENIFSTCSEAIEDLGARLLRARDMRVPLVEVIALPQSASYKTMQQIFGTTNKLALSILRADGIEHYDEHWGNLLKFENLGLSIPGHHSISLDGSYGSVITSVLESGEYSSYDDSRGNDMWGRNREPVFSSGYSYEDEFGHVLDYMYQALEKMKADFEIAVLRDGVIDVEVIEEIGPATQLTTGSHSHQLTE